MRPLSLFEPGGDRGATAHNRPRPGVDLPNGRGAYIDIHTLRGDMDTLRRDMDELRRDVDELKADMKIIKQNMNLYMALSVINVLPFFTVYTLRDLIGGGAAVASQIFHHFF